METDRNGNQQKDRSKLQTNLDPNKRPVLPIPRRPLVSPFLTETLSPGNNDQQHVRPLSHPGHLESREPLPVQPRPRSGIITRKDFKFGDFSHSPVKPRARNIQLESIPQQEKIFAPKRPPVPADNNKSNLNKLKSISAPDLSKFDKPKKKISTFANEPIFENGEDETDGQKKQQKKLSDMGNVSKANALMNKFMNRNPKKKSPVRKAHSFADPHTPASDQSFEIINTPPPKEEEYRFSELLIDTECQLFDYVLVVLAKKNQDPSIAFQFPPKFDQTANSLLESIPQFCFPDQSALSSFKHGETFSFVLTSDTGARSYGFCRMIKTAKMDHPEVCCIVSPFGLFTLYTQILEEVQFQRQFSSSAVFSFLKTILSKPLPRPTESLNVSFFSNGGEGGIRKVTLTRSGDSAIHEHVQLHTSLQIFKIDNILELLSYLLLEKQLVLCSESLSTLSSCCHCLISLMYPFEWDHTLIPVLPTKLTDILCLPTPFLLGIFPSVLPELEDLPIEDVSIFNLDTGVWIQKSALTSPLPKQISSQIEGSLKQVLSVTSQKNELKKAQNEIVTEIFVQMYLQLMGHFENHYIVKEGIPVINYKTFYKASISKEQKNFLKTFATTQAFQKFSTSRKQQGPSLGLFENRYNAFRISKSTDHSGYFKRHIDSMLNGFKKKY